jgi:hypothetical protein
MFSKDDEKYLIRLISSNQVVLFLGAGFSRDAKNLLKENFPTGFTLGQKIWDFLGYTGPYDRTPLTEMYQAFSSAGIKKDRKTEFLNSNLLSGEIPESYDIISLPYWYKIYTVNIDDVLTKTFRKKGKGIEELIFPRDQFSERDQSLENTQIIYLHGKLPCDPSEVIFSNKQYAKANLAHQPLYGQFVYDYAALATIFIGTDLNEPLFETYIAARESKYGLPELRPKSFLITPELSPVKADNLKNNYNVHHVVGYTSDFLSWLTAIQSELPDRISILKKTFPNLINIYDYANITGVSKKSLNEFAKSFNRVPRELMAPKERSGYLMGTSPRWNDILFELDIPRTITREVYKVIEQFFQASIVNSKIKIVNLTGYAGSGKSTILKRLGFMLSQHGRTAFLTYSAFVPKNDDIINVLSAIDDRVVLLFDNANTFLNQLPSLIKKLISDLKNPPIIVLGIRSNYLNNLNELLDPAVADIQIYKIPDLDDTEIEHLIEKLSEHNLLGLLQGKSKLQRFNEFKYRAHRQILIAMKEATNGKSFEEIIHDEFEAIHPDEAKILCVCVSICTEHSYPNTKQDFIGFSKIDHNQTLNFLQSTLHGTIIWIGNGSQFMIRHKILADYFIKNCATSEILKESYIRVLSILAPELKKNNGNTRKFNLFKNLINHQTLYRRFKSDINQAREVYESVSSYFSDNAHFWLQYGSLELEGRDGDLKFAENYLNQAESLYPGSYFIQNAKCNLYYKLSYSARSYSEAVQYKEKADELGHFLLLAIGKEEPYIYHIYCGGRYKFITKWITDKVEKKQALVDLKKSIKTAITFHPRNAKLEIASSAINRAYLNLGISDNLEDPELPSFVEY